MAYTSRQTEFLNLMISYAQDTANWPDGIPKLTDFVPGSIIYTVFSAAAVAGDTVAYALYLVKQAAYILTATGDDLDNKAADYGVYRKVAIAATASFTFTKNTPAAGNINIVVGTLISTIPDSAGAVVSFTTDGDIVLPTSETSVNDPATCQTAGIIGNIASNTQLVISSPTPGIDGVEISTNISNGVDAETDDALRIRVLVALQAIARGTAAWYQQTALAISGVSSAKVVSQNRGAGTVDVMIAGPNNTIPDDSVQTAVQAAFDAGHIITDDNEVQIPELITITASIAISVLSRYDADLVCTAVQSAVITFLDNLGPGAGDYGYVYNSKINAIASEIAGVADAATTFTSLAILPNQLPQASTDSITVTVV